MRKAVMIRSTEPGQMPRRLGALLLAFDNR
jgi:hypothetical protein